MLTALFLVFAGALVAPVSGQTKEAEYKSADQNFYQRVSVLRAEPAAVILAPGQYREKDGSYFVTLHRKPPAELYIQVTRDWLEPLTPPSMTPLGIDPDVMKVRSLQGDVQVATPDKPANFVPAIEGMSIPNGTAVKTGPGGSAAVLFGGVNSARFAPGSQALVEQTITPELRSTRIDLKAGTVFSKVGLRKGEKQDYQVHTPFGVAAARGTDFVCVALPDRTDVWIAQGTVKFDRTDGQPVGTIKAEGKDGLKIIRFPVMQDAHQSMMATAQTMTLAMNFIPTVNVQLKTLRDQLAQGVKMTPQEKTYMSYLKQVTCLIKLAPVAPPPEPPKPAPPTMKKSKMKTTMTPRIMPTRAEASMTPRFDLGPSSVSKPSASTPATTTSEPEAPIAHGPNDTAP